MDKNNLYYLAYGSNTNMEQMAVRCPGATPVGVAWIKDYVLAFKGSLTGSYLTIDKCKGGKVPVVVWKVTDKDVENLNRYEGYPTFYTIKRFKNLTVQSLLDNSFSSLDCFAYIMVGDRDYGKPSFGYLKCCECGYERFGLPVSYLDEALKATNLKVFHDYITSGGTKSL